MNKGVDDGGGVFWLHVLKILVENELLHRLIATDRKQNTGHFNVDTIITDIQSRNATNAVNARFQYVASSISQNVVAQIQSDIVDWFVTS